MLTFYLLVGSDRIGLRSATRALLVRNQTQPQKGQDKPYKLTLNYSGIAIINQSEDFDVEDPNYTENDPLLRKLLNDFRDQLNGAVNEGLLPICAAGNIEDPPNKASDQAHY